MNSTESALFNLVAVNWRFVDYLMFVIFFAEVAAVCSGRTAYGRIPGGTAISATQGVVAVCNYARVKSGAGCL